MKLDVTYQWPAGRNWFSAGDTVRGCIIINAARDQRIGTITTSLYGRTKISYTRSQNECGSCSFSGHRTESVQYQIFKVSKQLLSDAASDSIATLDSGVHFLPFAMEFPNFADPPLPESLHRSTAAVEMPPSLYSCSPNIRVHVAYFLKVKLQQRGVLRWKRNKKKELPFRLVVPSRLSLPGDFSGSVKFATLPTGTFHVQKREPIEYGTLPPYTPSIQLQLAIPSQVLRPEQPLPLTLIAFAPSEMLRQLGSLTLQSLLVRLRTSITIEMDGLSEAYVTYCTICEISDPLRLLPLPEGSVYQLSPSLRRNYFVPAVLPSFTSQGLSRTHALEVIAGFSAGDQESIQYISLSLDLALVGYPKAQDPPPHYHLQ